MRAMLFFAAALLAAQTPPGTVIDHQPPETRAYIGSPTLEVLADGSYVAAHDLFGPGSTEKVIGQTRVFRSTDRGKTWSKTAEFTEQFWSTLFRVKRDLYLMGTTFEYGRIVIRRSRDGGRTWQGPFYLTEDAGYHTAPLPVVEHRGRLWRSFEFHPAGPWGFFESLAMSAKKGADLTQASNWVCSSRLKFPADAPAGRHWLEGNIVRTPRGELFNFLRVANVEKAAVLRVDGEAQRVERFQDFPGGAKKFMIRYDRKTKLYWAMANPARPQYEKSATDPASVRNTLVLLTSPDAREWKEVAELLAHPDPLRHAFQYVDWRFEGNDLVFVSRTAFVDARSGPPRGHDANYMTFHRVENFRQRFARR